MKHAGNSVSPDRPKGAQEPEPEATPRDGWIVQAVVLTGLGVFRIQVDPRYGVLR
ncbi:hypothetical protein MNBD_PLANCTO03-1958 [hydrothermal vent metagenome]|uniref:Uncharacterized protein n=1 Tax=hydrothermal vent metagenome TaxID=652676 RepID=A0A3B1DTP4_9ZZZZ